MPARHATIHFTSEQSDFGGSMGVTETASVVAKRYDNAIRNERATYEVTFANSGMKMFVPTAITGIIAEEK